MKSILFSAFILCFCPNVHAVVHLVDVRECFKNLQWNKSFTKAKCIMRSVPVNQDPNAKPLDAMNFSFPKRDGEPEVFGTVRPLRNGYILRLGSSKPVVPEELEDMFLWAVPIAVGDGINTPDGLCARWLSELNLIPERKPKCQQCF